MPQIAHVRSHILQLTRERKILDIALVRLGIRDQEMVDPILHPTSAFFRSVVVVGWCISVFSTNPRSKPILRGAEEFVRCWPRALRRSGSDGEVVAHLVSEATTLLRRQEGGRLAILTLCPPCF